MPATLIDILPDKYYIHFFLLVKSIHILLGNSITEEDLQLTDTLLQKFCFLYENYYGTLALAYIKLMYMYCIHKCTCTVLCTKRPQNPFLCLLLILS